jgi:hypothetical protein
MSCRKSPSNALAVVQQGCAATLARAYITLAPYAPTGRKGVKALRHVRACLARFTRDTISCCRVGVVSCEQGMERGEAVKKFWRFDPF